VVSTAAFRFNRAVQNAVKIPLRLRQACRRAGVLASRDLLLVSVRRQQVCWVLLPPGEILPPLGQLKKTFRASTSRFGIGQKINSNQTPLGLHRVAVKAGGGWPVGAVFSSRELRGYTWAGEPGAPITHRILWLEGLEPGLNRGGRVDTFRRYIYIHGTGNEPSLGRPASHGCIHLAALDLMPLFDRLPVGTLVWIEA
jgi:hypothetical protein